MSEFLKKILYHKKNEVALMTYESLIPSRKTYSFYDFLKENPEEIHVIAEVKKASPSLGEINSEVNVVEQALAYQDAGASMISVLTDSAFFKGHIDDLKLVSSKVTIPTLAKDFIIDEKQIDRALNAGATVILLIVAALSPKRLEDLYRYATSIGLEVLVETHNEDELAIAHQIGAKIIGVNNRNLTTFETNLQTSIDLAKFCKEDAVYISESAIFTNQDVKQLAPFYQGILVGTALMKSSDVKKTLKELKSGKD